MFLGTGVTASVTHAAGALTGGTRASPKTLVVLVKTKDPTPAVAASELQKLVKDMAAEAKTEVRSERILPPAERGELLEIPVEIAVSCEIRQLVDLLAKLQNAPKLLPVQDLKIRVVNLTQPKDLLVTLTVSGFLLPAAQGKAKS